MRHAVVLTIFLIPVVTFGPVSSAAAAEFGAALLAGYTGGPGVRLLGSVDRFAQGFPLAIEAGVGYTWLDPGSPEQARVVFINDATNGTPQEQGWAWDLRLDFLYRVQFFGLRDAYLFTGVRYSMFTGNFNYIGGNEDFDVTSNQFGLGLGAKAVFPISARLGLMLSAGADYYFDATLEGHDTSYSPNGETVNGRRDYTYDTADEAINQPRFQPVILIGLAYTL